jgi:hypothetical protein
MVEECAVAIAGAAEMGFGAAGAACVGAAATRRGAAGAPCGPSEAPARVSPVTAAIAMPAIKEKLDLGLIIASEYTAERAPLLSAFVMLSGT